MRKATMLAMAAICAVGAGGEEMAVPSFLPATNRVEEGEWLLQDGQVAVSSESCIYKTGDGVWVIPSDRLTQGWTANFGVLGGELELAFPHTRPFHSGPELPEQITDKALIWVDADDADITHFATVTSNGTEWVDAWYDARELDVTAPVYARAVAAHDFTDFSPAKVDLDGYVSVYFGGRKSGRLMDWILPSGARYDATGVRSFFAVFGVVDSYGGVCGSRSSTPSTFRIPSAGTGTGLTGSFAYWHEEDLASGMVNGRTYLDGERIDGFAGNVRTGFHLLEAIAKHPSRGKVQSFFGATTVNYTGGDYLCEAIVFTNDLSEAERLEVERYLMAKWFPMKRGTKAVTLAAGAALTVNVDGGEVTRPGLRVKGAGTFYKMGDGTLEYENRQADVFGGELSIESGEVRLFAPLALRVAAGDWLSVYDDMDGSLVLRTMDAEADELRKDGGDVATLHGIPADVRQLNVQEGVLELVPALTNGTYAADDAYEVPIRNPGFEETEGDLKNGCYTNLYQNVNYCGWVNQYGGDIYLYDWHAWTGAGIGDLTKKAWNLRLPPLEGRCALLLPNDYGSTKGVYTAVDVPEDGLYEVHFLLGGRENDSYQHGHIRVLLKDTSGFVQTDFGRVTHAYTEGFKPVKLRAYATAGARRLAFQTVSGSKGVFVIDDIHLHRIPESQLEEWAVPNGNFEMALLPYGGAGHKFSETNVVADWTWTQAPGWTTGALPSVGLVSLATGDSVSSMDGVGKFYNDSREPHGDSIQLLLRQDGAAATAVFTPPAGTWLVQADLGRYYVNYGAAPTLEAQVTVGGVTRSLGRVAVPEKRMATFQWPTNFMAVAGTPVTLTFTLNAPQQYVGVHLDDVKLVKMFTGNLLMGGDCETGFGAESSCAWTRISDAAGDVPKGNAYVFSVTSAPDDLGAEAIDGTHFYELKNLGGIRQDVNFPMPGRYRLSLYSHSRLRARDGYGPGNVRAWTLADGVTNVLGHCPSTQTNWTERVFDFDVPCAGVRTVAIQGDTLYDNFSSCVDHVTLRHVGACAQPGDVALPENLAVSLAAGARLHLGCPGTNKVACVRLDGRSTPGYVSAATHPEYISGPGVLFSSPAGTAIIIR